MKADVVRHFRAIRLRMSRRTTLLFFELSTDSGLSGIGEATRWSGDDVVTAKLAQQRFDELIAERTINDIPRILNELSPLNGKVASLPEATARSALDQCLWDLRGQALGLPVHALLGGRVRDGIALYANINRGLKGRTPDDFADAAAAAVADGFARVKCAPFDGVRPHHGPETDPVRLGLQRLRAVRSAIGNDVGLMVDCHGRLGPQTCMAILPELHDLGLDWLEEPLITNDNMNKVIAAAEGTTVPSYVPQDLASSYAAIRDAGIRLAGGEFEYGVSGFRDLLEAGVLGCIMPDVKHCGGMRAAMTVDALAAERGVTVAPHNPDGPVATLASRHLCAAAVAFEVLEYQWREIDEPERLLSPYEPRVGGRLSCPDRPGFGSSLNGDAVLEYAIPLG